MSVANGENADAANFNSSFISREVDSSTIGKIDLLNSGSTAVTDLQNRINTESQETTDLQTLSGRPANSTHLGTFTGNNIPDNVNTKQALQALEDEFDSTTGHAHTGAAGEGKPILASQIASSPLKAYVHQGTDLTAVTGTSKDVSTELTGKSPSAGVASVGVVVTAPENKVILRQASGTETDDAITNGSGDIVYGRLTESAGVWTLSFFVELSAVETAYNITPATDVRWYYQEIYSILGGAAPVYSEFASIPSDSATADVVDATTTQAGKVRLATNVESTSAVVQSQDTRLPSQDENDALQGTNGTPSNTNRYVTNTDPRNTNQRDALSLQTFPVDTDAPANGEVLTWNSAANEWQAAASTGSGGGSKSWLTGDDSNFENTVGNWVTYKDASQATPVDGTGGAAAITFTRNTSTPLAGTADGKITKPASDVRGEGISVDFTIDNSQRGREQDVPFVYRTGSGYVNNFYRVFVYDMDAAQVLNVLTLGADGSLPTSISTGSQFVGRFTPNNSTSVNFRLIIHATTTNATAFDLFIDEVKPGPKSFINAPIETLEETVTVTGSWVTNTTYSAKMKRKGGDAIIKVLVSTSGAPTAANLTLTLPNSLQIDTARLPSSGADTTPFISYGSAINSGARTVGLFAYYFSATQISVVADNSTTAMTSVSNTVPFTFDAGDTVEIEFIVPILGWDAGAILSTTQVNNQTLQLVVRNSSSQSIADAGTGTKIFDTGNTIDKETHPGTFTSGVFTAPESGVYEFEAAAELDSVAWSANEEMRLDLLINGSLVLSGRKVVEANVTMRNDARIAGKFYMNAGSTAQFNVFQNTGAAVNLFADTRFTYMSITRVADWSLVGVHGVNEYIAATSSNFPLNTAGYTDAEWAQMTGNSVELPPGDWVLHGFCELNFTSSQPTATQLLGRWSSVNGDNTTTNPAHLSVQAGFTQIREFISASTSNVCQAPMSTVRVSTAVPLTVYLDLFANFTVAGDGFLRTYIYAERLQ